MRQYIVWSPGERQFHVNAACFRIWWQGEGSPDGRYLFFYDKEDDSMPPRADEPFREPPGRPRIVAVLPPGWLMVEDVTPAAADAAVK